MNRLLADSSAQAIGMGILVAVIGYSSSVAIVIHGLVGVGANDAEVISALVGLTVVMGAVGVLVSLYSRMPISVAWSTPGMALLSGMAALPGGFPAAVGAFIVAGLLIMVAGLWRPLGDFVGRIPRPIANGMLGGILVKLCLAPFVALQEAPVIAAAILIAWVLVGRFARLWAAPAALVVALTGLFLTSGDHEGLLTMPTLAFVQPSFDWQAIISIGLPLFIVTMASQNIPGLTVLNTYGYRPDVPRIFLATGAASTASAFVGAPTINLAAITAVLCAGPDAHADMGRRYIAAIVAGLTYMALGLFSGVAASLVTRASPILIEAVAGLALIPAFGSAMLAAVQDEAERIPALATFLVTASGLSMFGIGAAFWGLAAGLLVHMLYRIGKRT
jgi:benzoate membrane transport protein